MPHARTTLEVLTTMLEQMGAAGTPPTVLFFSSKLSGPRHQVADLSGWRRWRHVRGRTSRAASCIPLTFNRVGYAAGEARAHFYVIQPDDEPMSSQSLEGLENLAGVTGGTRLAIAANGDTTLDRVLRETTCALHDRLRAGGLGQQRDEPLGGRQGHAARAPRCGAGPK